MLLIVVIQMPFDYVTYVAVCADIDVNHTDDRQQNTGDNDSFDTMPTRNS